MVPIIGVHLSGRGRRCQSIACPRDASRKHIVQLWKRAWGGRRRRSHRRRQIAV